MKSDKSKRILEIYNRLLVNGEMPNRDILASEYEVSKRSIQRDINKIKDFIDQKSIEKGLGQFLVYDREEGVYRFHNDEEEKLTGGETLAICKVLLSSFGFQKGDMINLINKLLNYCTIPKERKIVRDLIANEKYYYMEKKNATFNLDDFWKIAQAINKKRMIEIVYEGPGMKREEVYQLEPEALMFIRDSFYLVAFIEQDFIPPKPQKEEEERGIFYHIEWIKGLQILDRTFEISYPNRFQEKEFRKQI